MESAKVVLVTNVGTGYGRAVALAYGRSKYHVVCADSDVELAAKTAAEIEELGGQAIPIQTDMTTQMDVLGSYHKVTEIFGALGGVVHLASQISTTPFEDLTEGEFSELMAENVRSSYLALRAASRLLNGGWVVVVAPPTLGSVQMHTVQGALKQLVLGFRDRFAYPRVNLVLPSRAPSDPRHDQALVRAVRFLGSPEAAGVSGQVFEVELPQPPRLTESLLPEVRAALDETVRQSEDEGWDEDVADDLGGSDARIGSDALVGAPGLRRSGGPANDAWLNVDEEDDYHDFETAHAPYDDGVEMEDADDEGEEWASELGLPDGPALRHLVGEDEAPAGASYVSGLESANDLYGDLRRLDGLGPDDEAALLNGEGDWPLPNRRTP